MTHKDHSPSHDQREISGDDMHAFTEKVRQVAPYTNQEIDGFGSYVTNFAFGDEDYISIYVPIAPELANEDKLVDDAVRVLIRMENPLGDGRSIVTTKSYIVHELDGEADYSEKSRVHDTKQVSAWIPTLHLASKSCEAFSPPISSSAQISLHMSGLQK